MTRIRRYFLFILVLITVAFPTPVVRADETPEVPDVSNAQVASVDVDADKNETKETAPTEKTVEPPVRPLAQSNIVVQPQPPVLPASPILITGYQVNDGRLQFFQLYNNSSDIVALEGWRVEYKATLGNDEVVGSIDLHAYVLPHQYAVFGQDGFLGNADSTYDIAITAGFKIDRLQLIAPSTYANNIVTGSVFSPGVRYELTKSSAGNYTSTSKFVASLPDTPLYGRGLYMYTDDTPLRVVEILANAENCAPLDTRIQCHDYIKLYNPSSEPVDMSTYRLRLGYGNQTAGISNAIKLSGIVNPKEYQVVDRRDDGEALDITASGGNVWLEDVYGLKTYDLTVQSYQDIGETTHKGHSWALDESDQTWKWGVPNPSGSNNFALSESTGDEMTSEDGLTPCRPDQERNPETNRCRSITNSSLTPCAANQYRSEETNRCRNLASTASSLTPCAPNQIRSLETNRCRSIASDTSTLVPCTANQERNPETNRCRNKAGSSVPDAAFAVQPVKDSGKAFVGWWALGGVGVLAVGYGAWEWRREMLVGIQKMGAIFTSRK